MNHLQTFDHEINYTEPFRVRVVLCIVPRYTWCPWKPWKLWSSKPNNLFLLVSKWRHNVNEDCRWLVFCFFVCLSCCMVWISYVRMQWQNAFIFQGNIAESMHRKLCNIHFRRFSAVGILIKILVQVCVKSLNLGFIEKEIFLVDIMNTHYWSWQPLELLRLSKGDLELHTIKSENVSAFQFIDSKVCSTVLTILGM